MSEKDDDKYQGIPIQKLPTIGRAYDNRGRKWRGSYSNIELKQGSAKYKKLMKIARILREK